ncbi:LOW QUALITY PROTEIN: uncharacterized protein C14orf93 homolog [Acipenser ruthenus]|uniref:LOW QUALITY PROTEIN: uncharacterized protein C14orf93 homolog n=1 Tax=Acipenser ruthenus TaxID=7906 RepID=UPI002740FB49|nr:LOW QUALITY PROTEIN: uncharacterized protein C14orf93 homolog [Acipenser ruthenus]
MSFSATILFTPPPVNGGVATAASSSGSASALETGGTATATPITVSGRGLALSSTEELLHLIYQKVDQACSSADSALALARQNHQILSELRGSVAALSRGQGSPDSTLPTGTAEQEQEEELRLKQEVRSPPPDRRMAMTSSSGRSGRGFPGRGRGTGATEQRASSVGMAQEEFQLDRLLIAPLQCQMYPETLPPPPPAPPHQPPGHLPALRAVQPPQHNPEHQRNQLTNQCAQPRLLVGNSGTVPNPNLNGTASKTALTSMDRSLLIPKVNPNSNLLVHASRNAGQGPHASHRVTKTSANAGLGNTNVGLSTAAQFRARPGGVLGGLEEVPKNPPHPSYVLDGRGRLVGRGVSPQSGHANAAGAVGVAGPARKSPSCSVALGGTGTPSVVSAVGRGAAPRTAPGLGSLGGLGAGQHSAGRKRRKRDVVLSKWVHDIHNHDSNNKRFNGSESLHSSWNMSVVKYLVEKLRAALHCSPQRYSDKELKGPCVAYFLTKRREYRNALNPYQSLKEREEKKLRSRRYRLFAYRSSIVSQFPLADRRLWEEEGVTEELMSDEEDSQSEPGVWVARSPRFRSPRLSELIQRINSSSKPGLKQRRKYGPESDRLPSREGLKGMGGGEGEGEGEGDIYSDRLTLTGGRDQGPGMIIIGENGQYCEETEVKREGED